MTDFLSEAIGTFVLILFGCGLNAGLSLNRSYSNKQSNSWAVGTIGWGLAVTLAIYAGKYSGAHINPAVTFSLYSIGEIEFSKAIEYLLGQCVGAFLACLVVFIHYLPHWSLTEDKKIKLGVFATSPAIPSKWSNLNSEIIGTFTLLFGLKFIGINEFSQGLNPIVVGSLVCAIGISLGGTTGYAINPVRDFIPRVTHFILPIKGKGKSNFHYSWIPIIGPLVGGVLGVQFYEFLFEDTLGVYLYVSSGIFLFVTIISIVESK